MAYSLHTPDHNHYSICQRAYTAQDTFVAKIVDLNEHIPPDPVATDTNPGYSVPPLPMKRRSSLPTGASGAATGCLYGYGATTVKMAVTVDEGYWEYEYTGYSASISGEMSLMPDDIVPTASGKTMKSGYGVKTESAGNAVHRLPDQPHYLSPNLLFRIT
mgnify:CR=1 FL=1